MENNIFCKHNDDDFKLENIGCPNYSEEFVETMGKQSKYWKNRIQLVPFSLSNKEFYITKLDVFDETIKENIDSPKEKFQQLERELIQQSEDSLFELFKLEEPNVPDGVIRAFIRVYIGFEMVMEREPRTLETCYKVHPCWKPFDCIDFDCEDMKVIDDYLLR